MRADQSRPSHTGAASDDRRRAKWAGWIAGHYELLLWALIAAGIAIRVVIAFATYGLGPDIDHQQVVSDRLVSDPLHLYGVGGKVWPYPGGFLPLIYICRTAAGHFGLPFHGVIQLPEIIADGAIAWLCQWWLGRSGRPPHERLLGAGLVALGPSFILISGYHGQIDSVATLPALMGWMAWSSGHHRRGIAAGLLCGLGAAVKTPLFFTVFALLPSARSRCERVTLVGLAALVPALSVAPFLAAAPHMTLEALSSNHGVPLGGWGLLVQPNLTDILIHGHPVVITSATKTVLDFQNLIVAAAVALAAAFVYRRRSEPAEAAVLIWLAVLASNPEWAYQYVIWGLPFFILARRYFEVAALQLLLVLPAAELYFHFGVSLIGWSYLPLSAAIWLCLVAATVAWVRHIGHQRPAPT